MPTTFSDLVPVRRVAVGDCSGPLGSGFDAIARSAYSALLAADWTEDSSAPFLPVHDNGQTANKSIPRGDAWKCSYGYDAGARTERSACGAVCYTFAVPADALSGSACNVSAISFRVTGDRYLDAGADVHVILDANVAPPSVATLAARTPDATVCATSSQTETPNRRHGVTADVELEPGVAATAYIHVALLLHDYTGNRGAWIEGGAMLEGAAVSIEFSRDVSGDTRTSYALDVGKLAGSAATAANQKRRSSGVIAPRMRDTVCVFRRDGEGATLAISSAENPQTESVASLLSPSVSKNTPSELWKTSVVVVPTTYGIAGGVAYGTASTAGDETLDMCGATVTYFARSGFAPEGTYREIVISGGASSIALPIRMVAYALKSPVYSARLGVGSLSSPEFWAARASDVKIIDTITNSEEILWASYDPGVDVPSESSTPATPLLSVVIPQGGSTAGTFSVEPFRVSDGYPLTLVVAFRAEPGGSSDTAIQKISTAMEISIR